MSREIKIWISVGLFTLAGTMIMVGSGVAWGLPAALMGGGVYLALMAVAFWPSE